MFAPTQTLTSFAVDDIPAAVTFYAETLGLKTTAAQGVLFLHHRDGHDTLVYHKPDHIPASYTVLNFVVDDVDAAVDELGARGVRLLRYDDLGIDELGSCATPTGTSPGSPTRPATSTPSPGSRLRCRKGPPDDRPWPHADRRRRRVRRPRGPARRARRAPRSCTTTSTRA